MRSLLYWRESHGLRPPHTQRSDTVPGAGNCSSEAPSLGLSSCSPGPGIEPYFHQFPALALLTGGITFLRLSFHGCGEINHNATFATGLSWNLKKGSIWKDLKPSVWHILNFWQISVIISALFFHSYNHFFLIKWIVWQISATHHLVLVVQSLSHVQLFVTPWAAACHASLAFAISLSLLRLLSTESVIPSNCFILCCPLLLLSSVIPRIRVFFNELSLCIRRLKNWSFSFSISPSSEFSRLISFRS